ncbi:hypothetical protein [Micromonospora globbae]|uniref:Uncharacterized protein n=1 Tax=Micromonospora globbae TaxID=1894969 RepID=A0A420ETY1_9ACTN|nr:hypothetical protein [Micromonospora globbae]RKF24127.1 hypothetical protein D7I43_27990 [Micromonospora globbae]
MTREPRGVTEIGDVDRWATEIAAALPPLTAAEAAAVGRLAAELDARHAAQLAPVAQHSHLSPRAPARRAA